MIICGERTQKKVVKLALIKTNRYYNNCHFTQKVILKWNFNMACEVKFWIDFLYKRVKTFENLLNLIRKAKIQQMNRFQRSEWSIIISHCRIIYCKLFSFWEENLCTWSQFIRILFYFISTINKNSSFIFIDQVLLANILNIDFLRRNWPLKSLFFGREYENLLFFLSIDVM